MNLLKNTTISNAVCGSSSSNVFNIISNNFTNEISTSNTSQNKHQLLSNYKNISKTRRNIDNEFCNSLIEQLLKDNDNAFLGNLLYIFLYGDIYYAPNTTIYSKIIKQMNSTFLSIEEFKNKSNNLDAIVLELLKVETVLGKYTNFNLTQLYETLGKMFGSVKLLKSMADCFLLDRFKGFSTENDAVTAAMGGSFSKVWAVIIFDENVNTTTELPDQITYKIRMNAFTTHKTLGFKDASYNFGPNICPFCAIDFLIGFIYIQDLLEKSIIEVKTNETYKFKIATQMTPYPCYMIDDFTKALSETMPLLMVLSWIFAVSMIIKDIVYEKEKRLKEFMRVMGLTNSVHWLAWFLTSFTILIIICFLLSLILVYGNIIGHTDLSVLFVFLCCFSIATITQSFLISVFFVRANLAAASGGVIYFSLYIPYEIIIKYTNMVSMYAIGSVSLLSPVAFGFGCSIIALYENEGVGTNWNNFYQSPISSKNGLTLNFFCLIMLLDSAIYMFLAWYIENVWPGEFGAGKPFYFLFQPSFWCSNAFENKLGRTAEKIKKMSDDGNNEEDVVIREDFRNENSKIGIEIKDLRKIYSRGNNYALKGITLNFYENEITSFLG